MAIANPVTTRVPERFNTSAPMSLSAPAVVGRTAIRASFLRSLRMFACFTSSSRTLRLIPDPGCRSQDVSPTSPRQSKISRAPEIHAKYCNFFFVNQLKPLTRELAALRAI
jgi:hypothetical protein